MRHIAKGLGLVLLVGCGDQVVSSGSDAPLALEEQVRFGSRDQEGASLTAVVGVVATSSEVFVLESGPARVAVFTPEGVWLRDIGRSGDGPGEFRSPSTLGLDAGRLWVSDPRGGRLEVFNPDGSSDRSVRWSVPADSRGTIAVPYGPLSGGFYLAGPAALPVGAVFTGAVDHRTYFRVSEGGDDGQAIYAEEIVSTDFGSADVSGRPAVVLHPHRQSPIVRSFPDGSGLLAVERRIPVAGDAATFRVLKVAHNGQVDSDWTVEYSPVSARGWRERFQDEMAKRMVDRSGSVDQAFLSALNDALVDIATLPPVSEVVAGSDGSIWLRREDTDSEDSWWDTYTPDATLVARTSLPRSTTILRASLEELWVVELDDLDVPFVVRYGVRQ